MGRGLSRSERIGQGPRGRFFPLTLGLLRWREEARVLVCTLIHALAFYSGRPGPVQARGARPPAGLEGRCVPSGFAPAALSPPFNDDGTKTCRRVTHGPGGADADPQAHRQGVPVRGGGGQCCPGPTPGAEPDIPRRGRPRRGRPAGRPAAAPGVSTPASACFAGGCACRRCGCLRPLGRCRGSGGDVGPSPRAAAIARARQAHAGRVRVFLRARRPRGKLSTPDDVRIGGVASDRSPLLLTPWPHGSATDFLYC